MTGYRGPNDRLDHYDWTNEKCAILDKLWNEGILSAGEIAKRLGVSKNAVVGKAHRRGLVARVSPIKEYVKAERSAPELSALVPTYEKPRLIVINTVSETTIEPLVAEIPVIEILPRRELSNRHQCAWPFGDTREPNFRFCCDPTLPGKSYCSTHQLRAYLPPRNEGMKHPNVVAEYARLSSSNSTLFE